MLSFAGRPADKQALTGMPAAWTGASLWLWLLLLPPSASVLVHTGPWQPPPRGDAVCDPGLSWGGVAGGGDMRQAVRDRVTGTCSLLRWRRLLPGNAEDHTHPGGGQRDQQSSEADEPSEEAAAGAWG